MSISARRVIQTSTMRSARPTTVSTVCSIRRVNRSSGESGWVTVLPRPRLYHGEVAGLWRVGRRAKVGYDRTAAILLRSVHVHVRAGPLAPSGLRRARRGAPPRDRRLQED